MTRNEELYNDRKSGMKYTDLAKKYCITPARCMQIYRKVEHNKQIIEDWTTPIQVYISKVTDNVQMPIKFHNWIRRSGINSIEELKSLYSKVYFSSVLHGTFYKDSKYHRVNGLGEKGYELLGGYFEYAENQSNSN